jgi:branched-chain amino acid transport system substrate-binding protein
VITSVPLQGPTTLVGSQSAEAACLAVEDAGEPVEHLVLDAGGGPFGEHVRANATRAAGDPGVVGYLGELHSAATEVSLPVLEAAGVPHLSFANTLRKLVGTTFVNVMPDDERSAAALVAWMLELGVRRPFLLDDGEEYGADMRWLVHRELTAVGVPVAGAERLFESNEPRSIPDDADAVFLGSIGLPAAAEVLAHVHERLPEAPLFGMDGLAFDGFGERLGPQIAERLYVVSSPAAPAALPPAGQEVTARLAERLGTQPDPHALHAYEAMALLLDALADAGPDRAAIAARLRATRDRDSVVGRYDIDARGATTLPSLGRLRIVGGRWSRV